MGAEMPEADGVSRRVGERTARPTPIEPPAPVTFSTSRVSPSRELHSLGQDSRHRVDARRPENGTTMVMGCDGKSSRARRRLRSAREHSHDHFSHHILPKIRSRHCEEHCGRAIHASSAALWIVSQSLSSGAHSRDPLASQ